MSDKPVVAEPRAVESLTAEQRARALSPFVRGAQLVTIPVKRAKRLVVLDWLAQDFEPGRHYTEAMVNDILRVHHPDTAALRRYLVDDGFLDRSAGEYWRCGGSIVE
jgi:hypothetical protein